MDDYSEITEFLRSIYPAELIDSLSRRPQTKRATPTRPFVTLTYAQSLDGKIAGPGGTQIRLSGNESMALTHRLREIHDFIMVGVGTMLSDDPQLNARIPKLQPLFIQPHPLILDSKLRSSPACKLIRNYKAGVGHQPTFVRSQADDPTILSREKLLVDAGAKVIGGSLDGDGHLDLPSLVSTQVKNSSLMVEGGASVISSFLASGLVDLVVITIAPVFVGAEGVSMMKDMGADFPSFEHVRTKSFGRDVVVVLQRSPSSTS
ncbi:bacterial bifunctional deaminase-reductase [Meredithblackwellia eburnea MCA 4105]